MNARATKAGHKKEETCLENLRTEKEIEGANYTTEQKRKGKMPKIKKDPAAPAAEKIMVSVKDYEVEEEEQSPVLQ